jgi:AmmeMemoRadiSam system protein B
MMVRAPVVSGHFYPGTAKAASAEVEQCLDVPLDEAALPKNIVAGIVPHAGWVCSGRVAGRTFKAIHLRRAELKTFVLFGAVHRRGLHNAAVFARGSWETPLGSIAVDERLAERILGSTNLVQDEPYAHEEEHSIEVQLPFIQKLFPKATMVPIMVPPNSMAAQVGAIVAQVIQTYRADAVCVGSTDLTHYGPSYGFLPKGSGPEGLRWAKEVNDRRLLACIEQLDPNGVLECAETSQSACGAGAIAAATAAARELGADKVLILEHTTSAEVLADRYGPGMADSVGYASIVFGKD